MVLAALSFGACSRPYPSAGPHVVELDAASCAPWPRRTAAAAGIAQSAIDSLQRTAVAMHSDALLIVRDGAIVHEWTRPGFVTPFNMQSITKAVTGLGVGVLLDRGRIPSLDLPLAEVFPEFEAPPKRSVTLRMLMNHTSGVAAARGEAQFYGPPDAGAFVRRQPLAEPAGTTFRYNNVGAQLVSHVVQTRGGAPLHALLDTALLGPLCIRDWRWDTDRVGATYGYSRLQLSAQDLAKVGQLVLDRGTWRDRLLLRPATVDSLTAIRGGPVSSLAPAAYVGLWQYWGGDSVVVDTAFLERLRAVPVSDSLLRVVRRQTGGDAGRTVATHRFQAALDSAFGPNRGVQRWTAETRGTVVPRRWRTPAQAVGHSGSWGQWLLVFPETRTVVVRFSGWENPGRRSEDDGYDWSGIVGMSYRLLGRVPQPTR